MTCWQLHTTSSSKEKSGVNKANAVNLTHLKRAQADQEGYSVSKKETAYKPSGQNPYSNHTLAAIT